MHKELVAQVRDISQKLTATSTLVVSSDGPSRVSHYDDGLYSTFWTGIEGLFDIVTKSSGRKPSFVNSEPGLEHDSPPRPVALVIMTADAHTHVAEAIANGSIDSADLAAMVLRLVVLPPEPVLVDDSRFFQLSKTSLDLNDAVVVMSQSDDDVDARVGSPALDLENEFAHVADDEELETALRRLRERSYLDGLRSRILRMQYEVDHFRQIAELALVSDKRSKKQLSDIKRSNVYRLAFAGAAPIKTVKRGRRVLKQRRAARSADQSGSDGSKAIEK